MSTLTTRSLAQVLAGALFVLALGGCAGTAQQESTGQYIDDTVITTKVKAALLEDKTVSGLQVNVESFKGVVQLSGFVKTPEQRAKAVELARSVPGVERVRDDILIR